jgi:hypothetical protein
LVIAALQDLFHTLLHPAKKGDVGDWIARKIWHCFRATMPRFLSFAGPTAFLAVVLYWAVSIVLGFALIYLPRLPYSFTFASGLTADTYGCVLGALNLFWPP